MTPAAWNALGRNSRPPGAGSGDHPRLLKHLRSALLEVKADPSRRLALLLIRVKAGDESGARCRAAMARLRDRLGAGVRSKAGRGRQDRVAWLGPGEFAVLTAPLNQIRDAERIAERLLALLAGFCGPDGRPAPLRAAIGIVAVQARHRSPEELLAEARQAAEELERREGSWMLKLD